MCLEVLGSQFLNYVSRTFLYKYLEHSIGFCINTGHLSYFIIIELLVNLLILHSIILKALVGIAMILQVLVPG